jgi:hypothetical protein
MFQVALSALLIFMYAHFETNNVFSSLFDVLTGVLEIFSLGLIWLVFFPPRSYQKLFPASDVGESPVEES